MDVCTTRGEEREEEEVEEEGSAFVLRRGVVRAGAEGAASVEASAPSAPSSDAVDVHTPGWKKHACAPGRSCVHAVVHLVVSPL